jgi:hypothetical protein
MQGSREPAAGRVNVGQMRKLDAKGFRGWALLG